jgi:hypothetical protein
MKNASNKKSYNNLTTGLEGKSHQPEILAYEPGASIGRVVACMIE